MGKILFTDLDGTLLNDRKEVTAGNRRAIEEAISLGRRVVVASGRPLSSAIVQVRRVGLAGPGCFVIAYNGAVIYDCSRQEEIFQRTLEEAQLCALFAQARRRGIYIQTYDNGRVLTESWCDPEIARRYCEAVEMEFRVVEDVRDGLSRPPVKALIIDFDSPEALEAMRDWIGRGMAGEVECFHSSPYFLEVVPEGVNKGAALRELCRLLDIPVAESVAAGDEANDITMLQAAGTGVAMANGVQAAKAAADYVTQRDNNHDGLEEVVRRFLL